MTDDDHLGALQASLESALATAEDEETTFHLRQALQHAAAIRDQHGED